MRQMRHTRRTLLPSLCSGVVLATIPVHLTYGTSDTTLSGESSWTGRARNNNFETGANWEGGVPGRTDTALFDIEDATPVVLNANRDTLRLLFRDAGIKAPGRAGGQARRRSTQAVHLYGRA